MKNTKTFTSSRSNTAATASSTLPNPHKLSSLPLTATSAQHGLQQLKGNEPAAPTKFDSLIAPDKNDQTQLIDDLAGRACRVTGTHRRELAHRILIQLTNSLVWPKSKDVADDLRIALHAMAEMEPQNETEAMLATQMIAANDAALMFLGRATNENQHSEAIDTNVLRATRLMRLFGEQLEAMQKLKGKSGRQSVRVEHVHVHDGGQAIVGAVSANGTS
jgi:hypothetical protein